MRFVDADAHGARSAAKAAAAAGFLLPANTEEPVAGGKRKQRAQRAEIAAEEALHEETANQDGEQDGEAQRGDCCAHHGKIAGGQHPEHAPGAERGIHRKLYDPDQHDDQRQHGVFHILEDTVSPGRDRAQAGQQLFRDPAHQLLHRAEGAEIPAEKAAPQRGEQEHDSQQNELTCQSREAERTRDERSDHVAQRGKGAQKEPGEKEKGGGLDQMPQKLGHIDFGFHDAYAPFC